MFLKTFAEYFDLNTAKRNLESHLFHNTYLCNKIVILLHGFLILILLILIENEIKWR